MKLAWLRRNDNSTAKQAIEWTTEEDGDQQRREKETKRKNVVSSTA